MTQHYPVTLVKNSTRNEICNECRTEWPCTQQKFVESVLSLAEFSSINARFSEIVSNLDMDSENDESERR